MNTGILAPYYGNIESLFYPIIFEKSYFFYAQIFNHNPQMHLLTLLDCSVVSVHSHFCSLHRLTCIKVLFTTQCEGWDRVQSCTLAPSKTSLKCCWLVGYKLFSCQILFLQQIWLIFCHLFFGRRVKNYVLLNIFEPTHGLKTFSRHCFYLFVNYFSLVSYHLCFAK